MKDLPTTSSFSLGKLYRMCKTKHKAVSKHDRYCHLNLPSVGTASVNMFSEVQQTFRHRSHRDEPGIGSQHGARVGPQ